MKVFATAVVGTLLALAALGSKSLFARCTIAWPADIWVNTPDFVRATGTVLRDTLATETRLPEEAPRQAAKAMLVRLEQGTKGSAAVPVGDTVAVFLWTRDPSCAWVSRDPLVPGEYHFTLRPRPDSTRLNGLATYDVVPLRGFEFFPDERRGQRRDHLDEFLGYLDIVPDWDQWEAECREGVVALERWANDHAEVAPHYPFNVVENRLRAACDNKMISSERDRRRPADPTITPPPEWASWATSRDCTFSGLPSLVRGSFTAVDRQELAGLCRAENAWHLLVGRAGAAPTVLSFGRGNASLYTLWALPEAYFDTHYSWDTRFGPRAPPAAEAILVERAGQLRWATIYQFEDGEWFDIRVQCCRWPGA